MTTPSRQRHGEFVPEWNFGDKTRKVRRELQLTQAEFAARLDIKENTYNAWETGRNTPSLAEAKRIAARLRLQCGIPEWWTLGVEPPSPRPTGPGEGFDECPPQGSNLRPTDYKIPRLRLVKERPQTEHKQAA